MPARSRAASPSQAGLRRQSTLPAAGARAHQREAAERQRRDPGHEEHDHLAGGLAEEGRAPRVADHAADDRRQRDPRRADARAPSRSGAGPVAGARTATPRRNATPATKPPRLAMIAAPRASIPRSPRIARTSGEASQPTVAIPIVERGRQRRPAVAGPRLEPPGGREPGDGTRAGCRGCRASGRGARTPAAARRARRSTRPRRGARARSGRGRAATASARRAGPGPWPLDRPPRRSRDGHGATTSRSAVRQWASRTARRAVNPSDRALAASRSACGPQAMTTTSAPGPLQPAQRRRERPRVAGRQDEHGGPGPDAARDDARAAARTAPRRGPTGARAGRAPAATWPGDDDTGDPGDPRLGARVAGRHQAERDAPPPERPRERPGDDVQRLDLVARRSRPPTPGPSIVWTSSAISTSRSRDGSKRLVIGRPTRALVRAWIRRIGSPGGVGPDAGEPRRVLGEARSGRGRGRPSGRAARSPWWGPCAARRGTCRPRAGDRRRAAWRTGRRRRGPPGPMRNTPRRSAPDVEPAHDALPRPQRPGVAQDLGAGLGAVGEVALADARRPGDASSSARSHGERQPPAVPDLDLHRDLVAERHAPRAERAR